MSYDYLIVGAGYAGSIVARCMAEEGKKILLLEKRNHIGGNAYDFIDENGVNQHKYGPHIFHTSVEKAVTFLSRFTSWYPYEHRVLGYVEGKLVPIPFNLTSIERLFDSEKAEHLKQVLIQAYGMEKKVPILDLRKHEDPEIRELADYIFEHIFKYYTMKQWGYSAEEIDPSVTARVPVHISYDDRYFQDSFQNMPKEGYTKIFERMLDHPNIQVELNCDANQRIHLEQSTHEIYFDGKRFDGKLIYTGMVDALMDYCLGRLSYRSLEFDIQTHDGQYQPVGTVNYPTSAAVHPFTRITEYKLMMEHMPKDKTTIHVEYPYPYQEDAEKGNIPYYPLFTEASRNQYKQYVELAKQYPNLYLLGRLAEYRYYNQDAIVVRALDFVETLKKAD